MPSAPVTVRLDPRRLEQLKAIALASGTTSTALIGEFVRSKIAAGVIPAGIPGVTVTKKASGVVVELGDGQRKTLKPEFARVFAARIREVVSGDADSTIFPNEAVAVMRQGSGFKIATPYPGQGVAFPGDLAVDLADLIETAAGK